MSTFATIRDRLQRIISDPLASPDEARSIVQDLAGQAARAVADAVQRKALDLPAALIPHDLPADSHEREALWVLTWWGVLGFLASRHPERFPAHIGGGVERTIADTPSRRVSIRTPGRWQDSAEDSCTALGLLDELSGGRRRHSKDYTSVHWDGIDHTFTPLQADCVRVLWEAMDNRTPIMRGASVLAETTTDQRRLRDVFKGHVAWGTMIVPLDEPKGTVRLAS